jgi:ubiquinone/menaquinone biosynthesis C-methylase UbiE
VRDEAAEQVDAWRSVAAGWEARRPLFWAATQRLSERLVETLDPRPGETILELAAGPGDTGFLAAERLGPGGLLLSTDVAPEMVQAARRRAAELEVENVEFRVVDAAAIDLPDGSVDGVVCRFGLMLVVDVEAAFAEVARVLRPGGRAALAVWAEPEANEWITAGGRAAVELGLLEPHDPDAPGPFRLHDAERLRSLLRLAGLQLEALEDVAVEWRASSLDEWWETWRDTSRMLSLLAQQMDAAQEAELRVAAARRLERYRLPDGSLVVPGVARMAAARRPA